MTHKVILQSECIIERTADWWMYFLLPSTSLEAPVNSIESCDWLQMYTCAQYYTLSRLVKCIWFLFRLALALLSMTLEMHHFFIFFLLHLQFIFGGRLLLTVHSLAWPLFSRALSFRWIFHAVSEWFGNFSLHPSINVYVGVKEKYWMYICIKFTPRRTSHKVERYFFFFFLFFLFFSFDMWTRRSEEKRTK